jgi:hypothetical protein
MPKMDRKKVMMEVIGSAISATPLVEDCGIAHALSAVPEQVVSPAAIVSIVITR